MYPVQVTVDVAIDKSSRGIKREQKVTGCLLNYLVI